MADLYAYEITINKAIERAHIEAIAIGIIGALMLGIALLEGALQRPLVFASYLGGIYATGVARSFFFCLASRG